MRALELPSPATALVRTDPRPHFRHWQTSSAIFSSSAVFSASAILSRCSGGSLADVLPLTAKPPVNSHIQIWSEELECEGDPESLISSHDTEAVFYSNCDADAEIVYYQLIGAGHHWPGGIARLPEELVGEAADQINATTVIWKFFQDYPKPQEGYVY